MSVDGRGTIRKLRCYSIGVLREESGLTEREIGNGKSGIPSSGTGRRMEGARLKTSREKGSRGEQLFMRNAYCFEGDFTAISSEWVMVVITGTWRDVYVSKEQIPANT